MSVVIPKPDTADGWTYLKSSTPGATVAQKVVPNSDGSIDVSTVTTMHDGSRTFQHIHQLESVTDGVTTTTTDTKETTVNAQGTKSYTTSEHDVTVGTDSPFSDKSWETTRTDSTGQVTTERGVKKVGDDDIKVGSETVETIYPDRSMKSETTSWSDVVTGTRYTEELDPNGNIKTKKTVPVWMARDGSWEEKPPAPEDSESQSDQDDLVPGSATSGEYGPNGPISGIGDDPTQPGAEPAAEVTPSGSIEPPSAGGEGEASSGEGSEGEATGTGEGETASSSDGDSSGDGDGEGSHGSFGYGSSGGSAHTGRPDIHVVLPHNDLPD